jgi:ATP-dependent helicase/nuclease subunit B
VDARPHIFSATQIETWIRDPYRIYVEKILGLRALDPLGGKPGVSERGSAIHAGLEIIGLWHKHRPQDPLADLRGAIKAQLAQAGFIGFDLRAEMARMDNGLKWLAAREMARLDAGFEPFVEKWGECQLQTGAGIITLKAKADRIDVGPLGAEVLDFKTGTPPAAKEVRVFSAPQLPVTALILAKGGFATIRAQMPADLVYIRLGGRNFGASSGTSKEANVESLVRRVEETITRLFTTFSNPDFAYRSKPRMSFVKKATFDDPIDRLARRAEWANADDAE